MDIKVSVSIWCATGVLIKEVYQNIWTYYKYGVLNGYTEAKEVGHTLLTGILYSATLLHMICAFRIEGNLSLKVVSVMSSLALSQMGFRVRRINYALVISLLIFALMFSYVSMFKQHSE